MSLVTSLETLGVKLRGDAVKYGPVIVAVAAGVASIAAHNYVGGVQEILQAIAIVSAGGAVAKLHYDATH